MSLETVGTGTPGAEAGDSCSLRSLITLGCRARAEAFARKLQDKLWTLGQAPSDHNDHNQLLSSAIDSKCQLHHHLARDVYTRYQTSWTVAETVNGDSVVTTVPFIKSRSKEDLYPVVCSCCTSTSMEHTKLKDPTHSYSTASSTQSYRLALAQVLAADNRLRDSDQYFDFGIETPPEPVEESETLLDEERKSLLVLNSDDGLPSQPESGCVFSSPAASSDSDDEGDDAQREEEAEESGDTSFYDVESLSESPATPFAKTFESILEKHLAEAEMHEEISEDQVDGSLCHLVYRLEPLTPIVTPVPDDSASTTAEPTYCVNSSASTLSNSPIPLRESPLDQKALSTLDLLPVSEPDKEDIKSVPHPDTGRANCLNEDVLVSLVMYTSSMGVTESTEEFASPLVSQPGRHVLRSLSASLELEEEQGQKEDVAAEEHASSRQTRSTEAESRAREEDSDVDVISLSQVSFRGESKDEADAALHQCATLSPCAEDVSDVDGILALSCNGVSRTACNNVVELQGGILAPEKSNQHAEPSANDATEDTQDETDNVCCVMDKFAMAVGDNNGERQTCFAAIEKAEAGCLDFLMKPPTAIPNGDYSLNQVNPKSSESESSGYTTESIPPSSDSEADSEDLACVLDKEINNDYSSNHLNNNLDHSYVLAQDHAQDIQSLSLSLEDVVLSSNEDDEAVTVLFSESDSEAASEKESSPPVSGPTTETAAQNGTQGNESTVSNKASDPAELESVEEDEEEGEDLPARRRRVQRSTSLKTGKTPPGTPGRKKIVRFADALGLDLAAVRTFMDEVPQVPKSAYSDLAGVEDEYMDVELKPRSSLTSRYPNYLGRTTSVPVATYVPRRNLPLSTVSFVPNRSLMAGFTQPGSCPTFLDKVKSDRVCLENAVMVEDMTIRGLVRVLNVDFHKSVVVRYTTDEWLTSIDVVASYVANSCDGLSDRFSFLIYIPTLQPGQRIGFAVCYRVAGQEFWDNNSNLNYIFQCISTCAPLAASTLLLPSPSDPWMPYL